MWLDEKNPEDPYNRTAQSAPAGGPSVGTGGGTTQPGGTASNPSTVNPIQPTAPAQTFGTVQDYLGANKQQGEQLGQQFTNSLAKSATNEKQTIDTAAGQTSQDIMAGTTPFNADLVNKAASDPTKVTGNPNDLNSFLKQWNASYTGPSSFENSANYAPATAAVTEAATKQTEAGTTGGQQQLLQDEFGVYGQGNKGLDQNLIQNSAANPAIQAQTKQFGALPDYLKNAATPINAQATKAAADTAATQAQTQGAFANTLSNFQTGLNTRVSVAQDKAKQVLAKYGTDLTNADPTTIQADLTASGVDAATTKSIIDSLNAEKNDYGVTPTIDKSYLGNPAVDVNSETVATPEDYAKAAAYQQLTGKDFSGVLNPADVAKAGTATGSNPTINGTGLQTYLKQGIDIKDNSILSGTPDLKSSLPDLSNVQQGTVLANRYINAATRQGLKPGKMPPGMQALRDQAYATGKGMNPNDLSKAAGALKIVELLDQWAKTSPNPGVGQPTSPAPNPGNSTAPFLNPTLEPNLPTPVAGQPWTDPTTGLTVTPDGKITNPNGTPISNNQPINNPYTINPKTGGKIYNEGGIVDLKNYFKKEKR